MTPAKIIGALIKHGWIVFTFWFGFFCLGVVVNYALIQPVFLATAKIVLSAQGSDASGLAQKGAEPANVELKKSPTAARMALQELGFRDDAARTAELLESIRIKNKEGLAEISIRDSNPEEAVETVNAYAAAVVELYRNDEKEKDSKSEKAQKQEPGIAMKLVPATPPTAPISPKRKRNILIFNIVGLCTGITTVLLLEQRKLQANK